MLVCHHSTVYHQTVDGGSSLHIWRAFTLAFNAQQLPGLHIYVCKRGIRFLLDSSSNWVVLRYWVKETFMGYKS